MDVVARPRRLLACGSRNDAIVIATFPDEHMYLTTNWLHGDAHWDLVTGELEWSSRPKWYSRITFANSLDLDSEDLSGVASFPPLKGRDLTEANLSDADIRHVDFSSSTLNRANFARARAEPAHFESKPPPKAAGLAV